MNESQRHLVESVGDQTMLALGKASPPVAVSAATVAGLALQDWVLILTAIYTLLQLLLLSPKVVEFVRKHWPRGGGEADG